MAAHYLITLRFLLPGLVTPRLLFLLIPQLIMHALPISCCMSIGMAFQQLMREKEDLFIRSFARSKRTFFFSQAIFVVASTILLCAFAGWWAPQWYRAAKQEVVASLSRVVTTIPSKKRVELATGLSVWCENKSENKWHNTRFCLQQTSGVLLVIAAKTARLEKSGFLLQSGSVVEHRLRRLIQHQFKSMYIPYNAYGSVKKASLRAKHATLSELWAHRAKKAMHKELARRLFHILLLLVLPWVMLLFVSRLVRQKFLSVVVAAALLFALQQVLGALVAYFC